MKGPNEIYVNPDMFEDPQDGAKVSVQVDGVLKKNPEGGLCIVAETVDGEPVPKAEAEEVEDPEMKMAKGILDRDDGPGFGLEDEEE